MRKKRGKGRGRWKEGAAKDEEKVLSEEGRALRGGAPEEIRVKRKEVDKPRLLLRRGGESGRRVVSGGVMRGRAEEVKVRREEPEETQAALQRKQKGLQVRRRKNLSGTALARLRPTALVEETGAAAVQDRSQEESRTDLEL